MSIGEDLRESIDEPIHTLGYVILAQRSIGNAQIASVAETEGIAGNNSYFVLLD